jgi:hypothetical protein
MALSTVVAPPGISPSTRPLALALALEAAVVAIPAPPSLRPPAFPSPAFEPGTPASLLSTTLAIPAAAALPPGSTTTAGSGFGMRGARSDPLGIPA